MAEKTDFFDKLTNYDPVKEVVPLALQKFHLDMEQDKFDLIKRDAELERTVKLDQINKNTQLSDWFKSHPNATPLDMLTARGSITGDEKALATLVSAQKPVAVRPGGALVSPTGEKIFEQPATPKQESSLFAKINPKDYTPESVKAFMGSAGAGTPNYDLLQKIPPEKTESDEQLVKGSLKEKLKREPTQTEILEGVNKLRASRTSTTVNIKTEATEKQRQRVLSAGASDLVKAAGGQDRLDYMFERYARYKEVPAMGMGMNLRWAFLGGAAQWAKDHGLEPRAAEISQMQTKGAQTAFSNLSKVKSVASTAGETAIKHGENALKIMDKKDRLGSPVVDRWIRAGKKAIGGDEDVTAFDTNVHFFDREVARYLTSMTAGGVMSQEEANEVKKLISSSETPTQFKRNYETAVDLIRQKEKTFNEQLKEIESSIPGRQEPNILEGSGVKPTHKYVPGKGLVAVE